jgi:hypothetical protein
MLLIESYCDKNKIKINTPICDKSGFIAYRVKTADDDNLLYRFVHYSWDQGKSHPGYYVFKFYEVSERDNCKVSCLVQDIAYYSWCDFFVEIEKIKTFINNCPEKYVPNSHDKATMLLWQSFIKTQDFNLANSYKLMPSSFYDSLDQTKSLNQQLEAHENIVNFLKTNNIILYNSWLYFIDVNIKSYFCPWFSNYVQESI